MTGREWHSFFNPQRRVPPAAAKIHGLTNSKLRNAPLFKDRVAEFLSFVGDAKIVAHNAAFDAGFINAELARCGKPPLMWSRWIDTLEIAKTKRPGKKNNLDALCDAYGVDRSKRSVHSALLDARLLAHVYLHLTGRTQMSLELDYAAKSDEGATLVALKRKAPLAPRISPQEASAHERHVAEDIENAIWLTFPRSNRSRAEYEAA